MSAASNGFGLKPYSVHPTGVNFARAIPGGIASGYASSIYQFSPVLMNTSGNLTVLAAATDAPIGVFAGVEYTDTNGIRQYRKHWPASTSATNIVAYIYDDADMTFEVQASGAVAQTAVGDTANFHTNFADGNSTVGYSTAQMTSTLSGTGASQVLRILGLSPRIDNEWGDAFTIVLVKLNKSQYRVAGPNGV